MNSLKSCSLRLWSNDQTLLFQDLRFACQAKCMTVWPSPKKLLVQHFCLRQAKNVFKIFQKHHAANFVTFACQAMFLNGQKIVVKQI